MSETIYFNNTAYISASGAAEFSGVTRDYITKLCRVGRIKSRRVGKNWYVAEHAFKEFLLVHLYQKSARREALTHKRLEEYQENTPLHGKVRDVKNSFRLRQQDIQRERSLSIKEKMAHAVATQTSDAAEKLSPYLNAPAGITQAAIQATHTPVYTLTPFVEIAHRLTALLFALLFVLGFYGLAHPTYTHATFSLIKEGALELSNPQSSVTNTYFSALAATPVDTIAHLKNNPAIANTSNSLTIFSKTVTAYGTALLTNTLATNTMRSTLTASVSVTVTSLSADNFAAVTYQDKIHTNPICVGQECPTPQQDFDAITLASPVPTSTSQSTSPNNTFRPIMISTSTSPRSH